MPDAQDLTEKLRKIEVAMRMQEELRGVLADEQLDLTLNALLAKKNSILTALGGSGAIAQGSQSTALGERAQQVNAPVRGDVLGAGATKVVHIHDQQGTADALRIAYVNRVFQLSRQLSLAGVDPKAASNEAEARLNLSEVYTALLISMYGMWIRSVDEPAIDAQRHSRFFKGKSASALGALNLNSRLVLLGDPGSGKSTFVNFVAMCLAGEILGRPDANLTLLTNPLPTKQGMPSANRQPWDHGPLLPIRVVLRDVVARVLPDENQEAKAEHLWEFITKDLEAAVLSDYAPHLYRELLDKNCLLLLDGLDEVPEASNRRAQITRMVEDFRATFSKCRILVTSRTYAYQKQDWRLPGFAEALLAPFSRGQILSFIRRWYAHIAALRGMDQADAQGRAQVLTTAVLGSERLLDLAARPLLLTLMASLHAWRGGSLPEKREELYADAVDLLLDWWESPKIVRDAHGKMVVLQPSLAEWLNIDRDKVKSLLNELAFEAHSSQPELSGTADIPEDRLVGGLMRLSQNPAVNPARLVEYLSQRAGLLVPTGVGVYAFPHRTFQEYLAACHLTDHDYPDKLAMLACTDPNRWREAVLLAGAKAARGSAYAFWALVEALCNQSPEGDHNLEQAWGARLAGQLLFELGDVRWVSEREKSKVDLVKKWHLQLLRESGLPPVERALAGNNLSRLGDPRFRDDAWDLPDDQLLGFVEIPEGPFLMGNARGNAPEVREGEPSVHEVSLPTFFIGRFLTTIGQFAAFVRDTDYKIEYPEPRKHSNNEAMNWVNWYDALAYCDWLTERLARFPDTPDSLAERLMSKRWIVTLPSEAEWEKAARGGILVATDSGGLGLNPLPSRLFPWGDEFDPNCANTSETRVRAVSSVGCFPDGASPYGVLDLSGNLWEWTRSQFRPYPYRLNDGRDDLADSSELMRVLRGGPYSTSWHNARCAARERGRSTKASKSRGFRLVLSQIQDRLSRSEE